MVLTDEQRKENKRICDKKYRERTKEKRKEYDKQYNINNKDKKDRQKKEWNKNNPQKRKDIANKYARANPKVLNINTWKHRGIIDEDFDSLYDYFITQTNCWICSKEFNQESRMNYRCLDHDHDNGEVRYICCGHCNLHVLNRFKD